MIDLRSDTVTKPTAGMKDFMFNALVGDDVWREDPTATQLEAKVAELFNKEAALFVPSGSMGNQICLKVLTEPGDEIIAESQAHIYFYETAAPSIISRIQVRTVESPTGEMPIDAVEETIREDIYYMPKTKLIALENTHNRHGGTILSLDYIKSIHDFAREKGLKMHLDGARIWNASAATGIHVSEYASYFDTISVCLSKGMGAPIGSLVVSTQENVNKALKWRKILGGGMRQIGMLAAAGIYAIDNNFKLLVQDHENARMFAQILDDSEFYSCDLSTVQTNIVVFKPVSSLKVQEIEHEAYRNGILIHEMGKDAIRAVFHLEIGKEDAEKAARGLIAIARNLSQK